MTYQIDMSPVIVRLLNSDNCCKNESGGLQSNPPSAVRKHTPQLTILLYVSKQKKSMQILNLIKGYYLHFANNFLQNKINRIQLV